jgi:hypothetical protein
MVCIGYIIIVSALSISDVAPLHTLGEGALTRQFVQIASGWKTAPTSSGNAIAEAF